MPYASALQLLARYNADEIAQRADASLPPLVDGELLRIAAAAGDLSGFLPDEQAAAAAALAKVERALGDAEQTIDTYLGGRYQLPLSQTPDVLERIACQIARFVLFDDAAPDQVKALYQDSIRFLEHVAAGKVQLGLASDGSTAQPSAGAEMVSGALVFARDNSRGFI
jgi:phage gp36-like protein